MATFPALGTRPYREPLFDWLKVAHETDGTLKGAVNVMEHGATGDGVTDDTTALLAGIIAAGGTRTLTSPPGKTYVISSGLILSVAGAELDFQGSTFKKASGMTANALTVQPTATNCIVRNLAVDGNRAGGGLGGGIQTEAANVLLDNCRVEHTKTNAVVCLSGDATYRDCIASDVDDGNGTGGSGNGFLAVGGVMRTRHCRALTCVRAGFAIQTGSAGSEIDGYAYRCGFGIQGASSNKCRVARMVAEDCNNQSVLCTSIADWTIEYLECRDPGLTAGASSAGGLQMNGCSRFVIGTLVVYNSAGYGLAIAGGSNDNQVGTFLLYSAGDPGIDISGGSSDNFIGNAFIRAATYAVVIGEGLAGANDNNTIGLLHVEDCSYGAYRIDFGSFNHVGRIVARDSYTTDATYSGLIDFSVNGQSGAATTDNVVGFIDHRATGTKPKYVVHFDANAVRNYVMDGFDRAHFVTADVLDSNGGNFVSPALGAAGTLRPA